MSVNFTAMMKNLVIARDDGYRPNGIRPVYPRWLASDFASYRVYGHKANWPRAHLPNRAKRTKEHESLSRSAMMSDENQPQGREPSRARALFSTADFKLLRAALASHAKTTDDPQELAQINALFHRLGNYF